MEWIVEVFSFMKNQLFLRLRNFAFGSMYHVHEGLHEKRLAFIVDSVWGCEFRPLHRVKFKSCYWISTSGSVSTLHKQTFVTEEFVVFA